MNKWSSLHLALLGHCMVEKSLGELQSTSFISPCLPKVPKASYLSDWSRTLCLPIRHTSRAAFSESCAKSITLHLQSLPSFFPFKTPLFQCPEKTRVFLACWEEVESHIARAWIPGYRAISVICNRSQFRDSHMRQATPDRQPAENLLLKKRAGHLFLTLFFLLKNAPGCQQFSS